MTLIGTVNGTKVYSNKILSGISNSRLSFTDGSWCDTTSGQIHNNGSGFITFGDNETTDKLSIDATTVWANSLAVQQLNADVSIEVHDREGIEYSVVGTKDFIDHFRAQVLQDKLVITSNMPPSSGGIVIGGGGMNVQIGGVSVFGRGSSVSIGSVNIGGNAESDCKVTIKVPRKTAVEAIDMQGNVSIGDTEGALHAAVNSSSDITAGRVGSVNLSIRGSGDIQIKHVTGSVSARVVGSGDIEIDDGIIDTLAASIRGSGDITIGGTADTADLTIQGSGDIRVEHVKTEPRQLIQGSGRIRVRHTG